MNLTSRMCIGIARLYPEGVRLGDVEIQNDSNGLGPYIKRWAEERLGPMPSLEALDAAGQQAEQEVAAEIQDKSTLRQQLRDETEAQWLARTDTQRMKFILKVIKAIEKRI